MNTTARKNKIAAASHEADTLAAAAADRHAKAFTEMFSIDAPIENLTVEGDDLTAHLDDAVTMSRSMQKRLAIQKRS